MSLEKITKDIDRTNVKDSEEHEMLYQVMSLMKHRLFKDVVDIQEDYSRVSFYWQIDAIESMIVSLQLWSYLPVEDYSTKSLSF